ncbi:acyl-CoA dehydrogenase family protein [Halobacillus salinus]|uniref:Isovaleryl-CoA dehydrogenase n=1 Tax=Halobacillus salinus TaxID=192814 RepID=A0A4Z0GZU7_9BACI|nr:acyl-CoA dehydrogenase family protein [Halobacillus salinus]TGB02313.1 isovaleryl-CoA dehydrogenase [Halobacillus salinus]
MNFFSHDTNLQALLKEKLTPRFWAWAGHELEEFGGLCATDIDERAAHTDREGQPKLIKYDRMGEDISHVWLNEGYKKTVADTYQRGIVGYIHKDIPTLGERGNYVYSFAQGYLLSQAEPGFYCPVTLTMATAYLIDHYADEALRDNYLPHVLSTGDVELYEGATFLTERQGGSDVGANEVTAVREGDHYRIFGEKYFASNAGACGVAMVLARMEEAAPGTKGLSLFLVPWRQENQSLNGIRIRRLKDKLGVRAVPSAEVEFDGAKAFLVGEPDQGFYYMMEALNLSRICNAVASIGIMRRAFSEALDYARGREAFGKPLIDYPMIKETLVHMKVKQELETRAVFEVVEQFDSLTKAEQHRQSNEFMLLRLQIALIKKETAEQAVHFTHEAIEMHGGNGYIEDFVTPRLLRDAQVLTVWEGTANILGLEVLRLLNKSKAHHSFFEDLRRRISQASVLEEEKRLVHQSLEEAEAWVESILQQPSGAQTYYSKKIAERLVLLFEASVALEKASESLEEEQKARLYIQHHYGNDKVQEVPLVLQLADDLLGVSVK